MDPMHMEAIETALSIENRSLSFYRGAASKVTDENTRRIFELLAKEEAEHVEYLCRLFDGNRDERVGSSGLQDMLSEPGYRELFDSVDSNTNETGALRIALREEQACIERYTDFAQTIREPRIRDVFIRLLNETGKHSELISEEYMRIMHMVDRTDQDVFVRE